MTMHSRHSSRNLIAKVFELLALVTIGWFTSFTLAAPVSAATHALLLGDWESVRVLVNLNDQMKWVLRPDDPRSMWRKYTFDATSMRFMNETFACEFRKPVGSKALSPRVLFDKESVQRPPALKGLLGGKLIDFDLGHLRKSAFTLYYSRCTGKYPNHGEANWIAATSTTLLVPIANSIIVLERPPIVQDAKHSRYCELATTLSESAICADRQLWQLRRYALASRKLAAKESTTLQAAMVVEDAAQVAVMASCKGDSACLYDALDADASELVQLRGTGWCGNRAYAPASGATRCIQGDVD
jgi:hypothetical protein